MQGNIKACPFCGATGEIKTTYNAKNGMYYTCVRCSCCYAEGSSVRTEAVDDTAEDRAIKRWNRRADD